MKRGDLAEWLSRPGIKDILRAFSIPKTPCDVIKELNIHRFNLRPFLKKNMIRCLNPELYTGRIYVLTDEARRLLKLPCPNIDLNKDWIAIGKVRRSLKLRKAVLKKLFEKAIKRTSEELREEKELGCMGRITIINILNDLVSMELVATELIPQVRKIYRGRRVYGKKLRRYYWVSEKGEQIVKDLEMLECADKLNAEKFC